MTMPVFLHILANLIKKNLFFLGTPYMLYCYFFKKKCFCNLPGSILISVFSLWCVNSRSLNFTSISQSHRFSCFYCWSCPCIILINKSRHGVHREGLPVLNYKLSQVLFCPNYKVSAWKWGKTFFKRMSYGMPLKWSWVISVICGKLAKTCRNTVCSWLVRVRKGFNVIPCISFTFHCTLLWPRLENHLQKKKSQRNVGLFKTILFPPCLLAALICKPNHATHHCEFGALWKLI